jgi:peptidoglycan/LPS O-acetylase OafA/YrhL
MRRIRPQRPADIAAAPVPTEAYNRDWINRLDSVEALRAIAFFMVFVFHAFLEFNTGSDGLVGVIYSNPWGYFFPHHVGAFGVQLFFVISGFCIHRSALRWREAHAGARGRDWIVHYAQSRFLRIYPAYLLVVLTLFALTPVAWVDLVAHVLLIQTLIPGTVNQINPSLWSLAVEAQLYALYPLALFAMTGSRAPLIIAACAGASLIWRLVAPEHTLWAKAPLFWGFEWWLGVAVAQTATMQRWIGWRTWLAGLAATLVVLAPTRIDALYATLPPVLFAALLGLLIRRPQRAPRWLIATGAVSYGLYLVHQPVLAWVADIAGAAGADVAMMGAFFVASAAGLGAALAIAVPLERAGRWFQSRFTAQ